MAKRRLPPVERGAVPVTGIEVSYMVGDYCESPDGTGPASAVGITLLLNGEQFCTLRMKSPDAVDEMIQALLRHKRSVWPDSH